MPQRETAFLRELLTRDQACIPGAKLAHLLDLPRSSLRAHLRRMERQGFRFGSVRGRGYRLLATPAQLHGPLIRAHLGRLARAPHLVCLDTIDSTNTEADRRLAAGDVPPLVILAQTQTQGRGRRGRIWHSPAQGNLYSTFVFQPELAPVRLQDFTLWMGLNLCELVANFCQLTPALKWPNDLYLGGRKAGGMLTEARIDASRVHDLIFGLGLNVNGTTSRLPPEVRRTAISLAEAAGTPLDLNKFAAAVIGRVGVAYRDFLDGSYRTRFAALWQQYDLLRGHPVTIEQGPRTVRGLAAGIDEEGSLLVRLDSGRTERFRAGEVTLAKDAR